MMRYVCPAILLAFSIVAPGLVDGQTLSITNYQAVSQQVATPTQWYLTYRADVVNTGAAVGSVTATLSSSDPFSVRVVQGLNTLNFANVSANGEVTSSNTFTVLASSETLDTSKLQWTFQTTPVGPVANAGPNQTASVGSTVTLNGSASTTPSGILSYSWKFAARPAGSSTVINNWTSVMPSFVVDIAGTYVVTLTVTNGVESGTANVSISTTDTPPVANAGKNQTVAVGATALLNGSASTDVDGDPLTYSWTMLTRPASSVATLTGPATVSPSFVVDQAGLYTIQLIVNDGFSNSAPSQVTISTLSSPPVANAGQGQVVSVGATVQLDGSGSSDTDGNPLTYQWSLITVPTGSLAELNNPAAVKPTFTADIAGTYMAQLIVTDGTVNSNPATVTITTTATLPPVANAGTNQTVSPGTVVSLSGSGIDPQSLQLTFHWSLTTRPVNSSATLSHPSIADPTFSADLPGTYIAQLIVNDGTLNSSPATVTITATAPSGLQVPSNLVVAPTDSIPLNVTLGSPAPANGLFITLASSNPATATVTPVIMIPGGATAPTSTPKVNGISFGSATITATAAGYPPATGTVQVTDVLSFSPASLTITGATKQQLYVFLPGPAPSTGLTLNVSSSNPAVATVPATVFINAGLNNVNLPVTALSGGSTTIQVGGSNLVGATALVTVNAAVLSGPATIAAVSGSPQTATVNAAFSAPLIVVLKDSSSNPVNGATVTFTAPGSGASGTFAGGVNTAVTNSLGVATSATFTANGTLGTYSVTASAAGTGAPALFSLSNIAVQSAGPATTATSGTPQTAQINAAFGAPLVVTVTDGSGNPSSGVVVTFSAPGSGPSGTFAGGANTALTNASGVATSAVFTANGTTGSYLVTASAPGIATAATFALTNISLNPTDIAITGPMAIGQGLQLQGTVTLGSPAPAGGLVVSIVANNIIDPFLANGGPRQIQVAPSATVAGADSTTITIPAGASTGTYYVQGTGTTGWVTYTVSVPGYTSQTATVTLSPSSFVVASSQGFGQPVSVSLSAYQQNHVTTPISIYAAMVDPVTDAFIANQELAGGSTVTVSLTDSNSGVGSAPYPVTIVAGSDHVNTQFTPQGLGSTVISVSRNPGNPVAGTDGSVTITVIP